jgi:hypothetical protein
MRFLIMRSWVGESIVDSPSYTRNFPHLTRTVQRSPTLDFNEHVLCKTLEEKLSCHLRLYQCIAYWSQQLTDAERDAFEAVIIPVFKKRFLCADTVLQQALLTYWENGGSVLHRYTARCCGSRLARPIALFRYCPGGTGQQQYAIARPLYTKRLAVGTAQTRACPEKTPEPTIS